MISHRSIPVQKLPNEVEGQNKIHVRLYPTKDKSGALTIEVLGKGMYPDGVTLFVRARHRKCSEAFTSTHAVIRTGLFNAKMGPFTKAIPGGGLMIEVWFVAANQTKEMQALLVTDHWYHSSPPCIHDRVNFYDLPYSMGGCDAEDKSEKEEKAAIASARSALLDASDVASTVFKAVTAKEKGTDDASKALTKLNGDLEAIRTKFNAWVADRQFLLFGRHAAKLKQLSSLVSDEARAKAATAGVAVDGIGPDKAPGMLVSATDQKNKLSDELKLFLDESGSLDKLWEESQKVRAKTELTNPVPGKDGKPEAPSNTPPK